MRRARNCPVVDLFRKRTGGKPALFGWATGGFWAGYYATLHSDSIRAVIMLNTLYGGSDQHKMLGHGTDLEDPKHAGQLNPSVGAYRWNSAASLFGVWDRSIPEADKSVARDPRVAKAYEEATLASGPGERVAYASGISFAQWLFGGQFLCCGWSETVGCVVDSRADARNCVRAGFLVACERSGRPLKPSWCMRLA